MKMKQMIHMTIFFSPVLGMGPRASHIHSATELHIRKFIKYERIKVTTWQKMYLGTLITIKYTSFRLVITPLQQSWSTQKIRDVKTWKIILGINWVIPASLWRHLLIKQYFNLKQYNLNFPLLNITYAWEKPRCFSKPILWSLDLHRYHNQNMAQKNPVKSQQELASYLCLNKNVTIFSLKLKKKDHFRYCIYLI